jgi:hypothetical protein
MKHCTTMSDLINKGKKAAASRLGSVPGAMPQGGSDWQSVEGFDGVQIRKRAP